MQDNVIQLFVRRSQYLVYIVFDSADRIWYTAYLARNIWYTPFLAALINLGIPCICDQILGIPRFWQCRSYLVYTVFGSKYWVYAAFGGLNGIWYTPYLAYNIWYTLFLSVMSKRVYTTFRTQQ